MRVTMILPALAEATSPARRPVNYALFPPLGLATLAGYLPDDDVTIRDDLYDTRHVVYEPVGMTVEQLESGYWRAYRDFYRWSSLWRGAAAKPEWADRLRHLAYAGGWKKFEAVWNLLIRSKHVLYGLPLLERALTSFGQRPVLALNRSRTTARLGG